MPDPIKPFQSTPDWLRSLSSPMDGTTQNKLLDAADELERLRSCFDALAEAIRRQGFEVLNSIDGNSVSIRRRER